jgi:hypothetical protein
MPKKGEKLPVELKRRSMNLTVSPRALETAAKLAEANGLTISRLFEMLVLQEENEKKEREERRKGKK